MARAIVELAIDSLKAHRNLDWLKDLAKQELERSLRTHVTSRMRGKHNQKILLWYKVVSVIEGKEYQVLVRIKAREYGVEVE